MSENRNATALFKNIFRDFIYLLEFFRTGRNFFFKKVSF